MEACIVICRAKKPKARKGRILFINAVNEVTRERAQSFLTDDHIERVVTAYKMFRDEPGFTRVARLEEIRQRGGSLNIPLHVPTADTESETTSGMKSGSVAESLSAWLASRTEVCATLNGVLKNKLKLEDLRVVLTIAKSLPNWLQPSEWKRLPFGAFAESIGDRVEPANAANEIYVGLDDLDSGSLHIRRWGKGSDVIGTKLRFRKGDIIFGRRRAYQRKLAVAEMDGICSAHAMVARAKPDMVLPEFLPFLMMSDEFMKRAVKISVGGLSPTINWTTLKLEEFDLPPFDQQRRIAEILWAVDEVGQHHCEISQQIEQLPLSFANHVTGFEKGNRDTIQMAALGEIADVIDCKHRTPKPSNEGVSVVSPGNIKWGALDLRACKLTSEEQYQDLMDHCVIREWDMVMGRNQTFGIASFVQPQQRFVLGQDTVLIQARKLNSKYIYLALQSSFLRSQINKLSIGSTFKRINLKDIRALRIPLAAAAMQHEAEMRVDEYEELKGKVTRNGEAARMLSSLILNAVMNGAKRPQ